MGDEKQKKNYETDFSFSFAGIADKVSSAIGSIGDEPETSSFDAPLGSATSAKVNVAGSIGRLHVHSGVDVGQLVKVEARHVGKMRFDVTGDDAAKTVVIENEVMKGGLRGVIGSFRQRDLYMDVALTPAVPLNLKLNGGLGEALLDLRGLTLSDFKLEGGVGTATVYLPDGEYQPTVQGGVGPAFVHLPAVTANTVKVKGGVGPMTITVAENADLTLDVECGVGPMTVNLPEGTPVMLEWESGLGPLSKPAGLVQKNKNVWHTEGFDLAGTSVYLKLEGGVGPARVNFVTPDGDALPGDKAKAKPKSYDV